MTEAPSSGTGPVLSDDNKRRLLASHEAGHATVAWFVHTWPHIALNLEEYSGVTGHLPARNELEAIAVNRAGIIATRHEGEKSAELLEAELGDTYNLRTRYPNATWDNSVREAWDLAEMLLHQNQTAWQRVRDRLIEADSADWRELTRIITYQDVNLICVHCGESFDVDDRVEMTRDLQGEQVCRECALEMPEDEKLPGVPLSEGP